MVVEVGKESRWITDLSLFKTIPPTTIHQDNQSSLRLVVGGVCHKRSKHFGIEFDWLQEEYEKGEIKTRYTPTKELKESPFISLCSSQRRDDGRLQSSELFLGVG